MIQILFSLTIYILLGYISALLFEKATKKWAMWDKKIGWQIHHSIFGVIIFLFIPLFPQYYLELLGTGLGIIIQHTLGPDGFVFIRRW